MCDSLVALPSATGGATLFAKNSDRPPTERQLLERVRSRRNTEPVRTTYITVEPSRADTLSLVISRPEWCWGAEHGVNEAGVAIGNHTIYTTLDPRQSPPALIGMDLVRLGLERGCTASAAVEVITALLGQYGQGGSGHAPTALSRPYWSSFLVADPTSAYVIETSGRQFAIEQVRDVRALSNRTTIAAFDAEHRHPRQPVETLVDPRLARSNAMLANRPVTVGALFDHLRSHDGNDDGYNVCMHVDGVEATTASIVAELPVDGMPRLWAAQGSPCVTGYDEFAVRIPT
jgi:secernin